MNQETASQGLSVFTSAHESVARLTGWNALWFAAVLGAISALAFAPFHLSIALVIATVGLVWMIDGARGQLRWGRAVFARGWAFGFGFFLINLNWTVSPFLVDPAQHAIFLWMPLFALPGGMALIWGAAAALAGAFWSASPSRVFIFALFMSGAELVRGTLFGGFPWNLAGTTWIPGSALSQVASIGGVYWLTMLTFLICAAPAALVDTREAKGVLGRALPSIIAVALVAFGWAWGSQRLSAQTVLTERTVTLMDVGVPQSEKFDQGGAEVLVRYANLLRDVPSETGDIVIWPEGALPFDLLQSNEALDIVSAFLGPRTLIAGSARRSGRANEAVFHNSLAVFETAAGRAELISLYDKHRLVPFGELPATQIIPFGEALSGILPTAVQQTAKAGFTPGTQPTVLYPAGLPPVIPLICYEGLFPEIIRHAQPRPENAEWILIISNDAWFAGFDLPGARVPGLGALIKPINNLPDMGPSQHYAQNRYRAIESGLPLVRVASRGYTAVVDGYGRETGEGTPFIGDPEGWTSSVLRTALPDALAETPYRRFGETFYWITFVSFAVLAFLTWRR
ncbi:MAG: apolipoprotein N-acyltransferase [Pseudomonadota bacterium]